MERTLVIAAVTASLAGASPTLAQSTSGVFVGAQVTGAALNFGSAVQKVNFGGGWGVHAGVGIGEGFSLLVNYDKASLPSAGGGGNYDLGQWDALARFNFMARQQLRPYVDAGITGRVAKSTTYGGTSGDYRFSGQAPTAGVGAQFFLGKSFAIDGGVNWTFGNFSSTENSGSPFGTKLDATGTRVIVGVSLYPFR
jgi:hypothetical protein